MSDDSPTATLAAHLAVLSLVSFGGIPSLLPDVHDFVVVSHGWVSDRTFANFFAVVQSMPGPNMVVMMSFIGWTIGGLPGALACAFATFGPSCVLVFGARALWDRFRGARWQHVVRRGLAPVTLGLVIAGGVSMARASVTGAPTIALTFAAAVLVIGTRRSPLWALAAGGGLGALGVL